MVVIVMLAGVVAGFAGGVYLSLQVFRRVPIPIIWPVIGMVIFAMATFLGSLMIATLTGGLGEEIFGTRWGPVVGVFAGCFIGSFVLNSLFGSLGLLLGAVVLLTRGQTDDEGRPRA